MEGRAADVRAMLFGAWLRGATVTELLDGPVASAMRRIGELWRHNQHGVMVEHRATDICEQTLHIWRSMLPPPVEQAPVAVGGAPSDDTYSLPSLMAATVFTFEGIHAVNLSKETPIDALAAAAEQYGAKYVWFAMSIDRTAREEANLCTRITSLADQIGPRGGRFVLGGRSVPAALRNQSHEAILIARSFGDLAAYIQNEPIS